jgi:DNA repair protein RecO (recombination protein O)
MERFECRAVVLSNLDYGEADRVVTLLSDERGRLAAFAKGARKSKRRFSGALEPFTLLKVRLAETRGDMVRLDAAEILDGFGELRLEIGRVARASYAAELVRELCRDHEPHPDLFALLVRFLEALARKGGGAETLMRFELAALAMAGLMPRLDRCGRCGKLAGPDSLFDPEHGGVVCPNCAAGMGARLSQQAARALAALQREGGWDALPGHVRAEARGLLTRFVSHHLGKRLKTLDFMREVGVEA